MSWHVATALFLLAFLCARPGGAAFTSFRRHPLAAAFSAFDELEAVIGPVAAAAAPYADDDNGSQFYKRMDMPAHLTVATVDIHPRGAKDTCAREIGLFCPGAHSGYGRIADCLARRVAKEDRHERFVKQVTAACRTEVASFVSQQQQPAGPRDAAVLQACASDAEHLCEFRADAPEAAGGLLPRRVHACLREHHAQLSGQCGDEVAATQRAAAESVAADWPLKEACSADAQKLCQGIKDANGLLHRCLRKSRSSVRCPCQCCALQHSVAFARQQRMSDV